ncbi:MAG: hypothetical protein ACREQI_05155 [Candidatus Binataceae bacterium]
MEYSQRMTIENYVKAMLRADDVSLPPRKRGCYSVWAADFNGTEPQSSDGNNIVLVGKTEGRQEEGSLLYRVSGLVLDAIGITGEGTLPGTSHSYFHKGGRDIFLNYGNEEARKLLITWCDDVCPSCEEHRIYTMFQGGSQLLNEQRVGPCRNPQHRRVS